MFISNINILEIDKMSNRFELLPSDIIQYELMAKMDYPDIINFCDYSEEAKIICDREDFWERKVQRDYSQYLHLKQPSNTHRDFYREIYGTYRNVNVFINSKDDHQNSLESYNFVGTINISFLESILEILIKLEDLVDDEIYKHIIGFVTPEDTPPLGGIRKRMRGASIPQLPGNYRNLRFFRPYDVPLLQGPEVLINSTLDIIKDKWNIKHRNQISIVNWLTQQNPIIALI
jgi:hypothetical protein